MKIAVVHSFYRSASPSGENTVVLDQVDALQRAGHDVALIGKWSDVELAKRFYEFRSGLTTATGFGPSPERRLRDFNPDVVHIHNLFPNFGRRWLSTWRHRSVATLHNYRTVCAAGTLWRDGNDCFLCPMSGSFNALRHVCYGESKVATLPLAIATRHQGAHSGQLRDVHTLVHLSHVSLERISSLSDVRARQQVIIPNFVDAPDSSTGMNVPVKSYFLYAGRLAPEKGILELVKEWPLGPDLLIAGDGPLRRDVEAAATSKNVRVLGALDRTQVVALMGGAVATVLPSLWSEGIPTTALESLAQGTPVVVSTKAALAKDIQLADAGITYEPGGGELAAALSKATSTRATLTANAGSLYQRSYSRAVWIERMLEVYRNVAA